MIKVKIKIPCPFCIEFGEIHIDDNGVGHKCGCDGFQELWVSLDVMYKIFLMDKKTLELEDLHDLKIDDDAFV